MENPESWVLQAQLRFTPSTAIFSCLLFWLAGWALSSDPRPEDCEPRHCGNELNISYPFWIRGLQNSYCGYPGYDITCQDDAPFLDVDGAELLCRVDHIFYGNMSVIVNEPRRSPCPYPRHNLSFAPTLFNVSFVNRQLFFYLNCTERLPGMRVIQCAENQEGKVSFVSGPPVPADENVSLSCESVISSPFLAPYGAVDYRSYESLLGNGFRLEWRAPNCSRCSDSGGRCGYNRTSNEFMCICRDRVHRVSCDDTRGDRKKKKIQSLVITFATLGAVMISLGCLGVFLKRKCGRKGERKKTGALLYRDMKFPSLLPGGENVADPPLLHFGDVLAATETFSPANKLGEGGFGPVYKGILPNGDVVAVKRLSKCSGQGLLEFRNEVELIARLQHKNIVQLLGWCLHEDEKILIYEYSPNRNPSRAIELDWEKRFHIIKGIAQGLLYLHHHSRLHIDHRDLKTSNILLDDAMNAKISDFGLARMFRGSQEEANTDRIVGTYGYMSPEYALDGHFSEKSDVFSFGVILLEIVSGRQNTGFYPYKESLNLLGHAWKLWNEDRGLELLDPSLGDSCPMEVVSRCMHVTLICIQEVAAARPTTSEIVGMLGAEINASLPTPRQSAFFMEHDSYGAVPTYGSIIFLTISSVESR